MSIKTLSILVLCILGSVRADQELPQHTGEPQIFEQLPFCDRSYLVLKECSEDSSSQVHVCCALLKIFKLQGCQCPGCDEQEDPQTVEELAIKGDTWIADLSTLASSCALKDADVLVGEASLPTQPLSKASLLPDANGNAPGVMDIAAFTPQHSRSLASFWEDWGEEGDEGEAEAELDSWEIEEDDDDDEEDDYQEGGTMWDDDGEYYVVKQFGEEEEEGDTALYEDLDELDTVAADEERHWDQEGPWGDEVDTERKKAEKVSNLVAASQGFVVRRRGGEVLAQVVDPAGLPATLAGASSSSGHADLAPTLVSLEALPSGEDFPTSVSFQSGGGLEDAVRAQRAQHEQQDAVQQEAEQVVVHRVRSMTISMDIPQAPFAAGKAAEVAKQLLEHLSKSMWGDRPLSRKLVIGINMDQTGEGATTASGSTSSSSPPLGDQVRRWWSHPALHAATLPSSQATPRDSLLIRRMYGSRVLTVQNQEGEGDCQCRWLQPSLPLGEDQSWLHRHYVAARLAVCQVSCQYRTVLVVVSVLQAVLLSCWLCYAVLRCLNSESGAEQEEGEGGCARGEQQQFVVCASDEEWRHPLLSGKGHEEA